MELVKRGITYVGGRFNGMCYDTFSGKTIYHGKILNFSKEDGNEIKYLVMEVKGAKCTHMVAACLDISLTDLFDFINPKKPEWGLSNDDAIKLGMFFDEIQCSLTKKEPEQKKMKTEKEVISHDLTYVGGYHDGTYYKNWHFDKKVVYHGSIIPTYNLNANKSEKYVIIEAVQDKHYVGMALHESAIKLAQFLQNKEEVWNLEYKDQEKAVSFFISQQNKQNMKDDEMNRKNSTNQYLNGPKYTIYLNGPLNGRVDEWETYADKYIFAFSGGKDNYIAVLQHEEDVTITELANNLAILTKNIIKINQIENQKIRWESKTTKSSMVQTSDGHVHINCPNIPECLEPKKSLSAWDEKLKSELDQGADVWGLIEKRHKRS